MLDTSITLDAARAATDPSRPAEREALVRHARTVLRRHWADILAVARAEGPDGLALAWAAHDIVAEDDMGVGGWPLDELVDLVAQRRPAGCRLLLDLRALHEAVDALIERSLREAAATAA